MAAERSGAQTEGRAAARSDAAPGATPLDERAFWTLVRRALLMIADAIARRYLD